jgi:hypothetical protein
MSDKAIEMFLELYRTRLTPEYQREVLERLNRIHLQQKGAGIIFITHGLHPLKALETVVQDTLNDLSAGDCFGFLLGAIPVYAKGAASISSQLMEADPALQQVTDLMDQIVSLGEKAESIIWEVAGQRLEELAKAGAYAEGSEGRAIPPEELAEAIANILKHSREG